MIRLMSRTYRPRVTRYVSSSSVTEEALQKMRRAVTAGELAHDSGSERASAPLSLSLEGRVHGMLQLLAADQRHCLPLATGLLSDLFAGAMLEDESPDQTLTEKTTTTTMQTTQQLQQKEDEEGRLELQSSPLPRLSLQHTSRRVDISNPYFGASVSVVGAACLHHGDLESALRSLAGLDRVERAAAALAKTAATGNAAPATVTTTTTSATSRSTAPPLSPMASTMTSTTVRLDDPFYSDLVAALASACESAEELKAAAANAATSPHHHNGNDEEVGALAGALAYVLARARSHGDGFAPASWDLTQVALGCLVRNGLAQEAALLWQDRCLREERRRQRREQQRQQQQQQQQQQQEEEPQRNQESDGDEAAGRVNEGTQPRQNDGNGGGGRSGVEDGRRRRGSNRRRLRQGEGGGGGGRRKRGSNRGTTSRGRRKKAQAAAAALGDLSLPSSTPAGLWDVHTVSNPALCASAVVVSDSEFEGQPPDLDPIIDCAAELLRELAARKTKVLLRTRATSSSSSSLQAEAETDATAAVAVSLTANTMESEEIAGTSTGTALAAAAAALCELRVMVAQLEPSESPPKSLMRLLAPTEELAHLERMETNLQVVLEKLEVLEMEQVKSMAQLSNVVYQIMHTIKDAEEGNDVNDVDDDDDDDDDDFDFDDDDYDEEDEEDDDDYHDDHDKKLARSEKIEARLQSTYKEMDELKSFDGKRRVDRSSDEEADDADGGLDDDVKGRGAERVWFGRSSSTVTRPSSFASPFGRLPFKPSSPPSTIFQGRIGNRSWNLSSLDDGRDEQQHQEYHPIYSQWLYRSPLNSIFRARSANDQFNAKPESSKGVGGGGGGGGGGRLAAASPSLHVATATVSSENSTINTIEWAEVEENGDISNGDDGDGDGDDDEGDTKK